MLQVGEVGSSAENKSVISVGRETKVPFRDVTKQCDL